MIFSLWLFSTRPMMTLSWHFPIKYLHRIGHTHELVNGYPSTRRGAVCFDLGSSRLAVPVECTCATPPRWCVVVRAPRVDSWYCMFKRVAIYAGHVHPNTKTATHLRR